MQKYPIHFNEVLAILKRVESTITNGTKKVGNGKY